MAVEIILDQRITTRLSLTVSLMDDFSQRKEVVGDVKVSIPALKIEAKKNPSGYYNFLDIQDGIYTLQIKSEYYIEEEIKDFTLPRNVAYHFAAGGGAPNGSTEAVLSDITGLRDGDVLEFDNGNDPPERRMITLDPDPSTKKIHWDNDPRGGLEYSYSATASITLPKPENFIIRVKLRPNPSYPFPFGATLLRGTLRDSDGNPISGADAKVAGSALETKTSKNGDFVLYFPASQGDASIQVKVKPEGRPPKTVNGEVKKGRSTSLSVIYP